MRSYHYEVEGYSKWFDSMIRAIEFARTLQRGVFLVFEDGRGSVEIPFK